VFPQNVAGASGARSIRLDCEPGAPTSEEPSSWKKKGLPALYHTRYRARPAQEIRVASWFLRVTPFLQGRATPGIQSIFRPLGEK
jgi:hypothetical protein